MTHKTFNLFIICCFAIGSVSAQSPIKIDLAKLSGEQKILTVNRQGGLLTATEPVYHMNEQPDAGFGWLKDFAFTNGTIEFDVKGKDVLQQSFVGIALHGSDEHTYESIYFRPFNFKADDSVRRSHSVQYISVPDYDWPVLREKFPNRYEQPIIPAPEPNDWFHAKIVVKGVTISVYVNHNNKPALVVQQIVKLSGNKIGFWVGNGSGGDWKNLVITPDKL